MSTPITSGAVNWTTPVTIGSNGLVTSTDLNALNYDAEFLYTKPYSAVFNTAASTSYGNGNGLFTSNTSVISNTPGSGSITFSAGTWTVPLTGLYRFTLNLDFGTTGSAVSAGATLNLLGATGGTVSFLTPAIVTNTSLATGISFSLIYPMSSTASATYPHTASFNFTSSGAVPVLGGTSPYKSFASVEYLGNNANY